MTILSSRSRQYISREQFKMVLENFDHWIFRRSVDTTFLTKYCIVKVLILNSRINYFLLSFSKIKTILTKENTVCAKPLPIWLIITLLAESLRSFLDKSGTREVPSSSWLIWEDRRRLCAQGSLPYHRAVDSEFPLVGVVNFSWFLWRRHRANPVDICFLLYKPVGKSMVRRLK